MAHINIAVDGPAGAGKSTVARAVAKELDILYLDTGAMYRAMALKAIRCGVDPNDEAGVLPLLPNTSITVEYSEGKQHTFLDGEDVTSLIRTEQVSKGASDIGVIPAVRIKLATLQQEIARTTDVVMDGRDIGSYVMPDSRHKFYITASVEVRARRRLMELNDKGQYIGVCLEDMCKEIESRDYTDSHREFAPLTHVPDAALIDTTDMDIPAAVAAVMDKLKDIG